MENKWAHGEDGINIEAIKCGRDKLLRVLNVLIHEKRI